MDKCQQVVTVDSMGIYESAVGHPLVLTGIILGIFLLLAFYTLGIFLLGFCCGRYIYLHKTGKEKNKVVSDKMTMSPVTYTSVRGVQNPRFEYNQYIDGCWTYPDNGLENLNT